MSDEALRFASKQEFADWLERHHADMPHVWIKFAKKGTGVPSIENPEALDVALCYGWIDGVRKSLDETYYLQRYTPRRARSKWSQVNVAKVAKLIASGEMRPAGLAEVERAKVDGRWDAAYPSPSKITVPDDLQAELDRDPELAASFAALDRTNRYAILYRLLDAKRPETRARRLGEFVAMLKRGERLH
jgi:uncharacterized protein YdeI (YjbR/CyaY-like superfamily)